MSNLSSARTIASQPSPLAVAPTYSRVLDLSQRDCNSAHVESTGAQRRTLCSE